MYKRISYTYIYKCKTFVTARSVSGSRYGRLTPKISALLSLVLEICDPLASISIDLWIIVIGPRD